MRPIFLNAPVGHGVDVTNDGNSDTESDTENGSSSSSNVHGNGDGKTSGKNGVGGALSFEAASKLLRSCVSVCVVDDDRTGEVVLLHKDSGTLIMSDLLYKSNPAIVGPGGSANSYSTPKWFGECGNAGTNNLAQPRLCSSLAHPEPHLIHPPPTPIHPDSPTLSRGPAGALLRPPSGQQQRAAAELPHAPPRALDRHGGNAQLGRPRALVEVRPRPRVPHRSHGGR